MKDLKHTEKQIIKEELSNLFELLNGIDFLDVVWQCECHCGLVITHNEANTLLWLRYDEEDNEYKLNSTLPEESFRGQMHQYQCLIQVYNFIALANKMFPEFAINLLIDITPLKYPTENE